MKVGKDSVVTGNVAPDSTVGDRSVVVGPTDSRGNTIHNKPMAVGYGAKAGPDSIAIGAHANAGTQPTKAWWERPLGILVLTVVGTFIAAGLIYFVGWN
ncbi:MAG: hypothetical protein A2W18_00655 [Candidatus Muproteobacteria bacterium RBG_16_60_9]|uniref:Uncharacterized protein n=1 Tax=Candidatus Muproteobacteria bacterium RBG_16_60_9 TaxID=1817755 RepID=A0A1F6V5A1_9PROT|nr:MAG: hypothetical protein A2W18_00655 [Candidatus Muproteobacteria bacterium RBG_16_60_9]